MKSDIIKEKVKKTNKEKFGNEFFTKSDLYRKEYYYIAKDDSYIKYLNDGISLFSCEKGHNFEISKDVYSKRKSYFVNICTVCNPVGDNNSIKEKEFSDFIKSIYTGDIINNYRDGQEIDIYLPELKIGFEFNGLYWHCDKFKDRWFHINKTNYFKEKEIRILHIWEDDWDKNREIIKSQICNLLMVSSNKIFARKCVVKDITDTKISKKFLNDNHLQGNVRSSIKIGLFNEDKLVSIMTFDHFEGRKRMEINEWNLSRFCNKLNTNVIGGASKLLKYFTRNYKPSRIISYADKDWSIGNLYENLGFNLVSDSKPDYKYVINGVRSHKSKFRKSRTNISESKLRINKIWDCGKLKYEMVF